MAVLRAKTRTKLFFRQNRPCRCVSQGFSPPVGERHLRENRTEPFAMICAQIEAQICKKWPFSAIFGVSFIYKIIHRDFTTGNFRAIRRRVINIYKCYQPVLSTPQAWPWKTLSNIYIIIYNLPKTSVLSVLSKSKIDIVFEFFLSTLRQNYQHQAVTRHWFILKSHKLNYLRYLYKVFRRFRKGVLSTFMPCTPV